MNERIKQLAEQANTIGDWGEDITEGRYFVYPNIKNLEKFAELIVAESVDIVENLSPGYKDYRDQIEDAFRRDCVIEIKKHFGVE